VKHSLNEEQQQAVNTLEGPVVCIAAPGVGKTTVVVDRFMNLLAHGVSSSDILTLTFTKAAADEMSDRAGFVSGSPFRTFHSYALSLIKKEREFLPFQLSAEILPVPNDIYEAMIYLLRAYRGIPNYKSLAEGISSFKNRGLNPEQALEDSYGNGVAFMIAKAYGEYERICREKGWLDFDSLMVEAVNLLKIPEVQKRNQFDYVQVDEGQDTNSTQFEILRLISKKNIFIVGDENQLIYEFRNAMPGSLTRFSDKFPDTKTLFLGTNYRSSHAIVDFLKDILPVDNGIASHMKPADHNLEGIPPTITEYRDESAEAFEVVRSIIDCEHTAIIARTNRQLEAFRSECLRRGMKFIFLGKSGFWEGAEVKKLISLIKEYKHVRTKSPAEVVESVISINGLREKYKTQFKFGDADPIENLNAVYKIATRFQTVSEFLTHVNKISHATRYRTGVTLTTVHQAKGKEYDHVYLVGVNSGLLPHSKGEIAEEKRIFYVGASRAAKYLHISFYGQPSVFIVPFMTSRLTIQDVPGAQQVLFGG
jgi:DNA helicase II / ATP-dependent DNA helicase PcrA